MEIRSCVVGAVQDRLVAVARRLAPAVVAALVATVVAVAGVGAMAVPVAAAPGAGRAAEVPSQSTCATAVVDTSGSLDVAAVTRAAAAETRARLVVRAYAAAPNGRLTAATDSLLASCFTADGSQIDPRVAVLSFSVQDRQTDVYLGRDLPGKPLPNELQTAMTDGFKAGRYTEGVVAAIGHLSDALDQAGVAPAGTGPGADPASTVADSTPTAAATPEVTSVATTAVITDAPGAASDQSAGGDGGGAGAGLILGVLAGGAVAVLAGIGGALALMRRRRLNRARQAFTDSTAGPLLRMGALRERASQLDARAGVWSAASVGRTRSAIDDARRAAREAGAATERNASLLHQATPRGVGRAHSGELESAATRLANLAACLDANQRAVDAVEGLGARLDHLRVALPAKRELLYGELAAAEALSDKRHGEGWKVDAPEAALTRIRGILDGLDLHGPVLDLLEVSDRMEGAEADLFATTHDLQSLPDRPGSIIAWREKQAEAAEMEERRAEALIGKLAETSPDHAPESWQGLSGHPDRALALIREATEKVDAAMELARVEQRFDDAGKALEEAGLDLMAADELLDQVDDLLVDLGRARAEAPGIVVQGRQVLEELTRFVERNRVDLGSAVVASPTRLADTLAGLELELRSTRPNFLRVARTGDRVNREIDQLLATAQQEEEQANALRRQADREVERAVGAVARAREALGWELFPSGDDQVLDALADQLASLPEDSRQRCALAQAVADHALAVQERIIATRRRRGNWIVAGAGTGGWLTASGGLGGSGGGGGGGTGGMSFGGGTGGLGFGGGGTGGMSFGGGSFGGGRASGGW